MRATIENREHTALVNVAGRLTFAEHSRFRALVQSLDDSGCHHIILDLGDLEHLDSAGMGMLLIARDRMAAKGGSVALRNAAGRTGRVLQLARFHGLFANDERNAQV